MEVIHLNEEEALEIVRRLMKSHMGSNEDKLDKSTIVLINSIQKHFGIHYDIKRNMFIEGV